MKKGDVIVITGSSRGIGAGLARGLAAQGYRVVINYSKARAEAETLHQEIVAEHGEDRAICLQADVAKRSAVQELFDQTLKHFGQVDVLINNAGRNIDGPFLDMSDESWQRVIDVVLTGTFICSQEFARRHGGQDGQIINIGASTAIHGRKNGVNYCSAKAGVITMTRCLALELAPKIKVNCVIPGYIETEEVMERYNLNDPKTQEGMLSTIPLNRLGTPEDVFRMVEFLISSSSYITGQNFFVNGGNYMG